MAGAMLKSHYEPTALRARQINQSSGCKTRAFGGLALNWPVGGGVNIYAVGNALRVGAKIIWMPTRDAQNSLSYGNMEGDFFERRGITVLKGERKLRESDYDIMDAVKRFNAVLAKGHLSLEESILLCREGRKRGVRFSPIRNFHGPGLSWSRWPGSIVD